MDTTAQAIHGFGLAPWSTKVCGVACGVAVVHHGRPPSRESPNRRWRVARSFSDARGAQLCAVRWQLGSIMIYQKNLMIFGNMETCHNYP